MKKITKVLLVLLVALMMLPLTVSAVADNETISNNLSISIKTDKSEYKVTNVAKITATITNTGSEDIENITAQALFNDLAPASKKTSETSKRIDVLKAGESVSFSYKATLNKNEHKLNIFQKIILFFVRLFNGGYTANSIDFDVITENVTDIKFSKFTAKNVVQVGYSKTIEEEPKNVHFEYLSSEPASIDVGETKNVLFYVDVNCEEKLESDEIELYFDEKLVGTLNDDGKNGDITANDNTYSGTFSMHSDKRKNIKYYVKYKENKSYGYTFYFNADWTEADFQLRNDFYADIKKIKEKYTITEEEYINQDEDAIERASQCYNEITTYLDNRSDVVYYDYTGFNIMVEFDSAIFLGIPLDDLVVKDENSKINMRLLNAKKEKNISNTYSTKSSIITLQPYQNSVEFGNSIATDESAYKIVDSYNYTFSQNLDNEHVTPDAFMSLSDYGIVILEGHGGNFKNIGYIISLPLETSVENYAKYITEISNGWLHDNGTYFVLTEKFFKEYYSENDFNNTIIYLGTCHGGDVNVGIRKTLAEKGAEAVMTYKNSVIIKYMHELLPTIFDRLSKGDSVVEAVNKAKKKHGDHDPYIDSETYNDLSFWNKVWYNLGLLESSNPAELILNGNNTSFKLSELKNCILTGTVTNKDSGTPIQNVTIEVKENNGDVHAPIIATVKTDDSGLYSMQLPYGNYILTLTHDDYKTISSTLTANTVCLVKDIALTWNGIVVPLPDKYTVTYTIFDEATEQPIQNVAVNVTEQGDSFDNVIESVITDENGQTTLTLPEGDYVLSLSHDNYQSSIVPVTFNAESTNGSIYLTPTRKVAGSGDCGANGDNVKWVLYADGELVISGSGDMADFNSGSSTPWYKDKTYIIKATICNGITHLGNYAFSNCSNLTDVAISNTLTSIGTSAFSSCTKLINTTIPDSVKIIGETAFSGCVKIENINIPYNVNKIGKGAFKNCKNIKSIVIPDNVLNIEPETFENCINLENVSIGSGVKRIGDEAFSYCDNLVNVNIAEGVSSIGQNVFVSCKNLENIIIPDSVTSIEFGVFQYCKKLKNISISNNITSIESSTFSNCVSLKSIIVPHTVKKIGQSAFYNCTNLQDITISNRLTTVGIDAFYNCQNLKNVYITDIVNWCKVSFDYPTSNPLYYNANLYVNGALLQELIIPTCITEIFPYAFINCNSIESVNITDNVTNIGISAFNGCTNLKDVVLSNNMKIISGSLFNNCSSLKNITIPSSITIVERNSFRDCINLTDITIPNSVTEIGESAFNGCSNLKNITIPNSVTSIGEYAFCGCTNLSTIAIPDSVTKINPYTFRDCTNIENVTIPNSVTNICSGAFYNCSSIEILTIPNSVTKIGSSVFRGCSNIKNITIPEQVTIIENALFYDCINLISVNIPNSVTIIGNSAFRYCKNITNITLPNNITSIGEYAFDNCYSLKTLNIPDSVTSLGRSAFSGCVNLESIIIPYGLTNISKELFYNCTNLQNIVIPNSVTNISEYAFYGCNNLSNIAIPNSVTSIGNNAFVDCDSLLSVEIPNSVTTIENSVFRRCDSLNSVIIPDSVISIGEDSFSYCISLKHITIPNSVTSIGECAFFGCKNLSDVNLSFNITKISSLAFSECDSLVSIIIPNGVTSIDDAAFMECKNLKSITIPKSVTYIGARAFSSCTNLTDVYYAGNANEWNKIFIYIENSPLIDSTIHYNA